MQSKIEYESRQQFVSKIVKDLQRENVQILWPAEVLCPSEDCLVVHKGKPVYIDHDHLSSVGAKLLERYCRMLFPAYQSTVLALNKDSVWP